MMMIAPYQEMPVQSLPHQVPAITATMQELTLFPVL
jgi:hypothetical protein